MGDADDRAEPGDGHPADQLAGRQDGLAALAAAFPDSPLARLADHQTSWPADLSKTPLIIDTDIGGDPDDAVALCLAARLEPRLALVLTCDETTTAAGGPGRRAGAARWLLDACDRPDVPVLAGAPAGDTTQFVLDHIGATTAATAPHRLAAAVRDAAPGDGPIRWVGIGPMSNLAALIRHDPALAGRLAITQMGGALAYRDPNRAEHNIRIDVPAAHAVLAAARDRIITPPEFVTSDVTFTPRIAISDGDALHTRLGSAGMPWAEAVATCLTGWFTHPRGYKASMQHDPLTLSAALALPFVDSDRDQVALDDIGRMTRHAGGAPVRLSRSADYPAFMTWLTTALDPGHRRPDPTGSPPDSPATRTGHPTRP